MQAEGGAASAMFGHKLNKHDCYNTWNYLRQVLPLLYQTEVFLRKHGISMNSTPFLQFFLNHPKDFKFPFLLLYNDQCFPNTITLNFFSKVFSSQLFKNL